MKFQTLTNPSYQKSFDSWIIHQDVNDTQSGMMSSYIIMNGNGYQSHMKLNSTDTISLLHPQLSIKLIGVNQIPIQIQFLCSDLCNRCLSISHMNHESSLKLSIDNHPRLHVEDSHIY